MNGKLAFENRKPLYNTTDFSIIKSDDLYSSNNPLNPTNDALAAISEHHIMKFNLGARFVFGQKYISRPDGKLNINEGKFPMLTINYEKGFAASEKNYNYDFLEARVSYSKQLGNMGRLS